MVMLAGEGKERMGTGQTVTDSRNETWNGVEEIDTNLVMVSEFAGDTGVGRKSSTKVRRKPSCGELRRPICGATSGGSKNGLYFWNPRIEGYAGIYIYT